MLKAFQRLLRRRKIVLDLDRSTDPQGRSVGVDQPRRELSCHR